MRTELIYELTVLGYEIYLEGKNIKFRYTKSGNPPDEAGELIKELRQCKQEAIEFLETNKHAAIWPRNTHETINWFMEAELPTEPFYLEPHRKVSDPEKFFASLRQEITAGPTRPRGRNGVLLYDLNTLKKCLN